MKPRVYVETTVLSYLTARPTRDLIQAAHRRITRTWWTKRRHDFRLYVSQVVVREAGAGHPAAATRRLKAMRGMPLLDITDEVVELADALIVEGPLPRRAADDALHLALAAVHGVQYLVTWNCKHLANAEMTTAIESVVRQKGFIPPVVCTPEELMGD